MNPFNALKEWRARKEIEEDESTKNYDPAAMRAALNRKPLEGLIPGDFLMQKKRGPDYHYLGLTRPCMFVSYLKPSYNLDPVTYEKMNILVAAFLDRMDGALYKFPVESEFFEKIDPEKAK